MPAHSGADPGDGAAPRARNKLWSQEATAEIALLRVRVDIITRRRQLSDDAEAGEDTTGAGPRRWSMLRRRPARPEAEQPTPQEARAICQGVQALLTQAELAADGRRPKYGMIRTWWSGNCIEAAFKNIHNAEATLAVLYSPGEVRAEIPDAVRRARESLRPGDPMRDVAQSLYDGRLAGDVCSATDLGRVIEAGHAAADRQRSRLRTFRNVLLVGMLVTTVLLIGLIALAAWRPSLVPLCFVQDPAPADGVSPNISCPTRSLRLATPVITPDVPARLDFFTVATLGLMGGALSAALFIRDLYTNATPYNISVPLAMLKLPAGALTGLVGIILLAGEFVPGFSAIDKQIQILAYALVFGFAQQVFTQAVDQRAQRLVDSVPTKARGISGVMGCGRAPGPDRGRPPEHQETTG